MIRKSSPIVLVFFCISLFLNAAGEIGVSFARGENQRIQLAQRSSGTSSRTRTTTTRSSTTDGTTSRSTTNGTTSRTGEPVTTSPDELLNTEINPPQSVTGVADSQTQVTLSWSSLGNPRGTEYFVENIRNFDQNSGWITATSYTFFRLTCNTVYGFGVKARNPAGASSDLVQVAVTTKPCAADALPTAPTSTVPTPSPTSTTPLTTTTPTPSAGEAIAEKLQPKEAGPYACLPSPLVSVVENKDGTLTETPLVYTNRRNIGIKIDTSYSSQIVLEETRSAPNTDLLEGKSFINNVRDKRSWTLGEGEGSHFINIRFRGAPGKPLKDTWACVILDTVRPEPPVVTEKDSGFIEPGVLGRPTLKGQAEPGTKIIIKKKHVSSLSPTPLKAPEDAETPTSPPLLATDLVFPLNEKSGCSVQPTNGASSGALLPSCALGNGPKWETEGLQKSSLLFDGKDDSISFGTVNASALGEISIVSWIRSNDGGLFPQTIFQYGVLGDDIRLNRTDDTTILLFDDLNKSGKSSSNIVIPSNAWVQIAVVVKANGTKDIYVNGALVSSDVGSSLTVSAIEMPTLLFGNRNDALAPFPGFIDQISLFPRSLSQSEIQGLYASESADLKPATIARHWPMSQGVGCVVQEAGGWNEGTMSPSCAEGPVWISDGIKGNAIRFDGLDDRIEIAKEPPLDFGTKDFSVSAWIRTTKKDGFIPILGADVLGASGGSKGNGFVLFLNNGYFQPCYYFESGLCMNGAQSFPKKNFLSDGNWHFVAVVFDRDGALRTFVDGIEDAVDTVFSSFNGQSLDASGAPFRIGSRYWTSATKDFFTGDIDEVNIHDSALSSVEVANAYFANKSSTNGAKDYQFHLDEESGCLSLDALQGAVATLGPNCGLGNGPSWSSAAVSLRSLRFDGNNDIVEVSGIAPSLVSGSGLSYAVWIRPESLKAATVVGGTGAIKAFAIQMENGLAHCRIGDQSLVGTNLPLNEWSHVACVYDTVEGKTKLFMNGKLIAMKAETPSLLFEASAKILFGNLEGSAAGFSGMIDEIELRSKVLSDTEVANLFAVHKDSIKTPIQYDISFNEGAGCVANGIPLVGSTKIAGILQSDCSSGNAPSWTLSGAVKSALSFDGIDDGVVFEKSPTFFPDGIKNFSVSLWTKPALLPANDLFSVLGTGGLSSKDGWIVFIRNQKIHIQVSQTGSPWLTAFAPISLSGYHHVAGTFEAKKGVLNLFVDGVTYTHIESPLITPVTGNAMSIGYRSIGDPKYFGGAIDEIKTYDRALTASEVLELSKETSSLAGLFKNQERGLYQMYRSNLQKMLLALMPGRLVLAEHEEDVTYTTEADENGNWSFVFPTSFEDGNYAITVHSEDSAGNVSEPVEEELVVSSTEEFPSSKPQEEVACEPPSALQDGVCVPPKEEEVVCEEGTVPLDGQCVTPWKACPGDQVYYEGECHEETFECPEGYVMRNDWCMAFDEEGTVSESASPVSPSASPASSGGGEGSGGSGGSSTLFPSGGGEEIPGAPLSETGTAEESRETEEELVISREAIRSEEEVAGTTLARVGEQIASVATAAAATVERVINDPKVEKVNEQVVAPAVVVAAAVNVAVGFRFAQILNYLRYLFFQPILLTRRRKFKKWGVVYDAFRKIPIDLATIRVLDAKVGTVIRSQVTDIKGRYFILLQPGSYMIEVDRTGYESKTDYLRGKREDGSYAHLLSAGDPFTVTEENSEINYNIPLEPEDVKRPTALVLKDHTKRVVQHGVSVLGLGVSIVSLVISPTPMIAGMVGVHIVVYSMFRMMAYRKLPESFGLVKDAKTKKSISGTVIRVFDTAYDKLVATTVTDHKGRYAVLVGGSRFYATYEKDGYRKYKSEPSDYSSAVGGILKGAVALVPE